tara:strand:- start:2097 stop:3092 length:996 start_codon:yes stop_codon:yes gene_type:complete
MSLLNTYVTRGGFSESVHKAICNIKDINFNTILSTNNKNELIFPRSSIKIFQALPFILSDAHKKFGLDEKKIAISCSSHTGEDYHIKILESWINKILIKEKKLLCGIHMPIDSKSNKILTAKGKNPSQLHNNCSGKHLGMISGCLSKKMNINNYLDLEHPYQNEIRKSLSIFMEYNIKKKNYGIDGCGALQYPIPLENLAIGMINLLKTKKNNNEYSKSTNVITNAIKKYPYLIGGTNRFDSEIIKTTKGRIFSKGGAEGVLLFADFVKNIGGVIKILDGHERAVPSLAIEIFKKLKLINQKELKILKKWQNQNIYNHNNKLVGNIFSKIK